jgi:hypothetical protein
MLAEHEYELRVVFNASQVRSEAVFAHVVDLVCRETDPDGEGIDHACGLLFASVRENPPER